MCSTEHVQCTFCTYTILQYRDRKKTVSKVCHGWFDRLSIDLEVTVSTISNNHFTAVVGEKRFGFTDMMKKIHSL